MLAVLPDPVYPMISALAQHRLAIQPKVRDGCSIPCLIVHSHEEVISFRVCNLFSASVKVRLPTDISRFIVFSFYGGISALHCKRLPFSVKITFPNHLSLFVVFPFQPGIPFLDGEGFSVQIILRDRRLILLVELPVDLIVPGFAGRLFPICTIVPLNRRISFFIKLPFDLHIDILQRHRLIFRVKPGFTQSMLAVLPDPVNPMIPVLHDHRFTFRSKVGNGNRIPRLIIFSVKAVISVVDKDLPAVRIKVSRPTEEASFIIFPFEDGISACQHCRSAVRVKITLPDHLPQMILILLYTGISVLQVHQPSVRSMIFHNDACQIFLLFLRSLFTIILRGIQFNRFLFYFLRCILGFRLLDSSLLSVLEQMKITHRNRPDIGILLVRRQNQLTVLIIIPGGHFSPGAVVFIFHRGVSIAGKHRHSIHIEITLLRHFSASIVFRPDFVVVLLPSDWFAVHPIALADLSLLVPFITDLIRVLFSDKPLTVCSVEDLAGFLPFSVIGIGHPGISRTAVHLRPAVRVDIDHFLRQVLVIQLVDDRRIPVCTAHRLFLRIKVRGANQIFPIEILVFKGRISHAFQNHQLIPVIIIPLRGNLTIPDKSPLDPADAVFVVAPDAFIRIILCLDDPVPRSQPPFKSTNAFLRVEQASIRIVVVFKPVRAVVRIRIGIGNPGIPIRSSRQLSVCPVIAGGTNQPVQVFTLHGGIARLGIEIGLPFLIHVGYPAGIFPFVFVFRPCVSVRSGRQISLWVVPAVAEQSPRSLHIAVFGNPVHSCRIPFRVIFPGFFMLVVVVLNDRLSISFRTGHRFTIHIKIRPLSQLVQAVSARPICISLTAVHQVAFRVQQFFLRHLFIGIAVSDRRISSITWHNRISLSIHICPCQRLLRPWIRCCHLL